MPDRPHNTELDPLIRLHQIVEELRAAAKRDDREVVRAAAALLGPTVEQCKHLRDPHAGCAGEAVQMAMQIHVLLAECEEILTTSLKGVAVKMKRIQQGKKALAMARKSKPSAPAHRILQ